MSVSKVIGASILAMLLCSSTSAFAGSTSGAIALSLNVSSACAVNGGTVTSGALGQVGAITFADQPGIFGDVDASLVATGGGAGLSILCSPGLAPTMTVGSGAHATGSVRHLAAGSNQVAYRLYSDAGRANEIATGQQISLGTMTSSALAVPIYARVNSGGAVLAAGAYTDTVQVTLAW